LENTYSFISYKMTARDAIEPTLPKIELKQRQEKRLYATNNIVIIVECFGAIS